MCLLGVFPALTSPGSCPTSTFKLSDTLIQGHVGPETRVCGQGLQESQAPMGCRQLPEWYAGRDDSPGTLSKRPLRG